MLEDTDRPPNEYSAGEWAARGPELIRRRAKHDPSCTGCVVHPDPYGSHGKRVCQDDCQWRCRVFLCRDEESPHRGYACGGYVGACMGGSDDNRCADCWVSLVQSVKRRIVSFIRNAPSGRRREDAICRKFGLMRSWWSKPEDEDSAVEDLLSDLVTEGVLHWDDPDNDRGQAAQGGPLWYRVVKGK